ISVGNNINNKLILIRVDKNSINFLISNNLEIVGSISDQYFDVILTQNKLKDLDETNINYEIVISDVLEYENSVRGNYHTLAQVESILQDIANNYPSITTLYSIGTTYEGRNIWCLEITDNPGVD
ncbi:MAG: M14 family zinc carboxypeptidase, partial [Thermoplasmatota archaeon]